MLLLKIESGPAARRPWDERRFFESPGAQGWSPVLSCDLYTFRLGHLYTMKKYIWPLCIYVQDDTCVQCTVSIIKQATWNHPTSGKGLALRVGFRGLHLETVGCRLPAECLRVRGGVLRACGGRV